MRVFTGLILALAIVCGQLIKLPIFSQGGITMLDITVIAFSILGIIKLKFKLKKPPLFLVSAFLFIGIGILSLIFTPLHLQLQEYLISSLYIARFSVYILLGWEIYSGAYPFLKDKIASIFLFSGIILAVLGLLQFIFLPDLRFLTASGWDPHYFRTVSTFLDPNFAGAYLTLILLLIISNLGGGLDRQPRDFYIKFVILFLALLTTFSRSSYLMFLIGGLSLAFMKKSKLLFIQIIILFLILLLGFQIYTKLISQPRNIDRTKSASFRLDTWQQGLTMFEKYPFLGVGYNSYRYALRELNLADEQFIKSHGASSNDSSLLFVAATTGILGLLSYLFLLSSLIWKTKNYLLTASLLGLIIHSFFANSLFYPPILLWIIFISTNPKR